MSQSRDEIRLPGGGVCLLYDVGEALTIASLDRASKFLNQRWLTDSKYVQVQVWHNGEAKLVINLHREIEVI